ncbi:MAG: hypothetical protein LC808_16500, partial [Actinobacteria bacterium]|nr:hypothetical protein [Actinomycetota bacterium]
MASARPSWATMASANVAEVPEHPDGIEGDPAVEAGGKSWRPGRPRLPRGAARRRTRRSLAAGATCRGYAGFGVAQAAVLFDLLGSDTGPYEHRCRVEDHRGVLTTDEPRVSAGV